MQGVCDIPKSKNYLKFILGNILFTLTHIVICDGHVSGKIYAIEVSSMA